MEDEMDKMIEEIQQYQITDSRTIRERKRKILQKIVLDSKEMDHYQELLKEYRFVDEVDELRIGSYIRFFRLNTDTLSLRNGGFLVDIKIHKQIISLLFKNRNQFFKIKMDDCLLFQKHTSQEHILIQILDQIKS